jgi:hypothetical protein
MNAWITINYADFTSSLNFEVTKDGLFLCFNIFNLFLFGLNEFF